MAAARPPDTNDPDCCLLTIFNSHSGRTYLINTGAQVSVVPVVAKGRPAPSSCTGNPTLCSANCSSIQVHYTKDSDLLLAGRKFSTHLLHAEVDFPLLGANYLYRHHLLVDIHNKCLVDTQCWLRLSCSTAPPSSSSHLQSVTTIENTLLCSQNFLSSLNHLPMYVIQDMPWSSIL